MKTIFLLISIIFCSVATAQYNDVAPAFTKEKHRKIIANKMNEIIKRIKIQTECKKEITYEIIDTYLYYKDQEKNLPKTVIFNACGQKLTYINYLSPQYMATIGGWNTATWTLDSASK